MPNINKYDLEFTPESYWESKDVLSMILRNVKGQSRRRMIRDYYQEGMLQYLDDSLLSDDLDDDLRRKLGRVHPQFMGGEYLESLMADDAEICRIELNSMLGDVISIRAAKKKDYIVYNVLDEYGTDYTFSPKVSPKPLSFRKLIDLIDGCYQTKDPHYKNLAMMHRLYNYWDDMENLDDYRYFVRFESEYYPQLAKWYDDVAEEWYQEEKENQFEDC